MTAKYFVAGSAGNNNYSQTGSGSNWATSDGGAGGQTPAASTDDVFLTTNSPNMVIDLSGRSCLSITCTGYTGTITFTNGLTVLGNVTLASGMTLVGPNGITVQSNGATLTSAGKICNVPLTLTSSVTHTLADNWTVTDVLTLISTSVAMTINGYQIDCQGGVLFNGTSGTCVGTTVLKLTASQTISAPAATTGRMLLPMTIDTAGTITVSSYFPLDFYQYKYVQGTIAAATTYVAGGSSGVTKLAGNGGGWVG